ncbi:hypothetical protein BGZ60DRAFT_522527 [Tricladium varicosporioides]|nr:hypothetical protein BGZ60DRAFT_522527 [Hymenoscyphus varicosporioides]
MTNMDVTESQRSLQIGCYVLYGIAMLVFLLRLYARAFVVRSFGLDDYFIIGGALGSTAILVTVPIMFNLGIGLHITTLTNHEGFYGRQAAWIPQIFYYFALAFIKCSIVALYTRLVTDDKHLQILYWLGGFVMLHGIIVSIVTAHMCSPISIIWGPTFPVGCIDLLTFNYFNAAFHILTDLLLALLPIPVLTKLQLSTKRKIALGTVFAAGGLTIAATICRQVYNFIALTQLDFSWNWAPTELVTNLEINMGIICASIPAIQALFKKTFGSTVETSYPSYERQGHSKTKSGGFEWHSKGRNNEESVKDDSAGSEDGIVLKGAESGSQAGSLGEGAMAAEPWSNMGRSEERHMKAMVGKGAKRFSKQDIQLKDLGDGNTSGGVMKKVDYRVEYSPKTGEMV